MRQVTADCMPRSSISLTVSCNACFQAVGLLLATCFLRGSQAYCLAPSLPSLLSACSLTALHFLTVEVNAFFLKYELWVPPRNPLNTYRLLLWWLIANPAVREFNVFVQARQARQLHCALRQSSGDLHS